MYENEVTLNKGILLMENHHIINNNLALAQKFLVYSVGF